MKRALMGLAAGLLLVASVSSQPFASGPGMTGGTWGPGGYMPGPGMMGGFGGPGIMGGYGMGPDMMGGYGGFGNFGGYGYGNFGGYRGPGMTGAFGSAGCIAGGPELTPEQGEKMSAIQNEFSQRQWALMQKMQEQAWRSARGDPGAKFDEQAARKSYEAMAEVRKQMFESSLEMQKRFDALLTPQQREQMRRGGAGR